MRSIPMILCLSLGALGSPVSLAQAASGGKVPGAHGISINGAVEPPWTLLQQAVIKLTPGVKNDILRHTIVVTGSDGYAVVLSVGEIDPKFGGDRAIIAYSMDGKPLRHGRGPARLIVPTDKAAGRAVSDVVSITVR
jgi:hypothetical protein